jgi:hypothetical protein
MINRIKFQHIFLVFIVLFSSDYFVSAQEKNDYSDVLFYKKKELNNGILIYGNNERDQLRTDLSKTYEETLFGSAAYQFKSSFWNFLDYKQDFLEFTFDAGPFYGSGDLTDSSYIQNLEAEHSQFGIRTNVSAYYASRYYYNPKNYTIVEVNGRARFDWFKQNTQGTAIDSNGVVTNIDENVTEEKFRFGFEAKAGWGWGRLNPLNNYMMAEYILTKYYAGRVFSEEEIRQVAEEIYMIKRERDIVNGHKIELESQLLGDFLREKLFLTAPENLEADWEQGEFFPRVQGNRVEVGPFFRYYNQEPDFIYGGYIQYDHAKYCTINWNRDFGVGLKYNRYKKQDWINAEIDLGWSYFPDLKRRISIGIKYVPGVELNDFSEIGEFNHGIIPSIGYFSQINSKSRVNFTFAYRISEDEKLMLPGPEFSLSVYRSRY